MILPVGLAVTLLRPLFARHHAHDQADGNKAVRAKAIVARALFSDKLLFRDLRDDPRRVFWWRFGGG
jgi:hypothetical protein